MGQCEYIDIMAQHMEVRNEKAPKILQNIGASIEKEKAKLHHHTTAMKWEWLYRITGREEDKDIYVTERYIGPGIVYGSKRGSFEVHIKNNKIEHIYLVA